MPKNIQNCIALLFVGVLLLSFLAGGTASEPQAESERSVESATPMVEEPAAAPVVIPSDESRQRRGPRDGSSLRESGDERGYDRRSFEGRSPDGRPSFGPPQPPVQQSVVQTPRDTPAGMVRFFFRNAPWRDVIEWFADQAVLSLQADRMPTGTLNLTDNEPYTPTEALDILNAYLQFKDYSLVRKGKTLFVLYLPDGIPANLLDPITAEELDTRGKYEICRVIFNLNRTQPADVQAEVERLLGPQGNILPLPRSQQIVITETGGTLRTIRELIRRMDDPDGVMIGTLHTVEMRNLTAEEAIQTMRQLLAIEPTDASLRTAVDSTGKRVYLSGQGVMVERARDLLTRIDRSFAENNPEMWGEPQFETYEVGTADPATVFSVLQTLLMGTPDARLSLDPRTNGIMLRARPAVHASVKETIAQMQLNVPQIAIIPLRRMSPQTAVDRIKMFIPTAPPLSATTAPAPGGGGRQQPQTTASSAQLPTVEADTMARQIIVRGTLSQIKEIRDFLATQGEDGNVATANVATSRVIPISPAATALVMEQLQGILPALGPNINVIAPALEQPPVRQEPEEEEIDVDEMIDFLFDKELPITRIQRIAVQPILAQVLAPSTPKSDVNLTVTPAGIVLTSDDPEALAKVEELIRMLSDEMFLGELLFKEYYLTHATASVVSSELQSLMNTTAMGGVSGMGSVDLPEWEQAEVLGLLAAARGVAAGSGAIEKTGTVTVSVNERLNSLWVQANRVDHKTVERLLKILDQPARDDIMNRAIPRTIRLYYMKASEARTLVEQAFANQMGRGGAQGGGQSGGQQQRGGQPQMMIQGAEGMQQMMEALQQVAQQGGRARGGGAGATPREQEPPMTLAVDAAVNELIVTSTESMFVMVERFVRERDEMASQQPTVMVTQKLVNVTPSVLQPSLSGFLGDSVRFGNIQTPAAGGFGGQRAGGFAPVMGGGNMMGGGTFGAGPMGAGTFGGATFGAGQRAGGITPPMGAGIFGGATFGAGQRAGGITPPMGAGTFGGATFGAGQRAGGITPQTGQGTFGGARPAGR